MLTPSHMACSGLTLCRNNFLNQFIGNLIGRGNRDLLECLLNAGANPDLVAFIALCNIIGVRYIFVIWLLVK